MISIRACTIALFVCAGSVFGQGRGAGGGGSEQLLARGADLYNKTCATGYCHGVKGASGGAPRLASRGFDAAYITQTVRAGINGTGMPGFGTVLDRADMAAVVAYVGSLNGIAPAALPNLADRGMPRRQLPAEAAKGRALFFDAVRGFGRCSTCHQVDGVGIAVTDPISKAPASAAELKSLASPHIVSATADGAKFPALVLSKGAKQVKLYDLTMSPPVLRTLSASEAAIGGASNWSHAKAISAYSDGELESIVAYLKVAVVAQP